MDMTTSFGFGASGNAPPRVYCAGSMKAIETIKHRVADLESRGFMVVSSWHARDESSESYLEIATTDWFELRRAQMVVVNADVPSSSGGYWTELGGAIAYEKPTIVIGDLGALNVFSHLPSVSLYKSWGDYLNALDAER